MIIFTGNFPANTGCISDSLLMRGGWSDTAVAAAASFLLGHVLENLYVIIYAARNFAALIPVALYILLKFLLENTIHTWCRTHKNLTY